MFDQYTGAPIPEGKKSLAYSISYRAPDRTLTDAEVNRVHEQVVAEDGNLYPFQRDEYEVHLAAGKTSDAVLTVYAAGSLPVFDRALRTFEDLRRAGAASVDLAASRRRTSAMSIQPPIATIVTAAMTGAPRTTTSGGNRPCAPTTSAAQASTGGFTSSKFHS